MKGRNFLLPVPALLLAIACENPQQPNGLAAPRDPSGVISDGTREGGNPDFFFLPPLMPNPNHNSNFERGKFNNALQASLTVEICELVPEPGGAVPTGSTACANDVANPHTAPVKTFAAGTVRQVGLPSNQSGWWSGRDLPDEGFYYVLWDTRQSNLDIAKYYRIKVLIAGSNVPLGYADVDPMSNMREWHNVRTGDLIAMVDDATLPIPFRVERGALCDGGNCNSATITNSSPTGSQSVVVDAGGGSIAGAKFPNGWLPSGDECPDTGSCPQSVVVTVSEVNIGQTPGTEGSTVCHPDIPFQQFKGCFSYTTTPALEPINEAGDRFALPVTVAVCFELEGTGDPREKFVELYASGPGEPTRALEDVPDGGLLGVTTKDCSSEDVVAQSSNPVLQLASTGWRKMKGGLGRFFGVKTAYAVDLGLGGIVKGFSHIGPALPAHMEVEGPTNLGPQPAGTEYILNVMVIGSNHHGDHIPEGIGGVPVTFTVASTGQGTVEQHLTDVGIVTPTSVESITRNDSETRGEASAMWHLPDVPGTYTLTVTSKATGSPVTFTATVNEVWHVIESGGWNAEWTRRGSTDVYDGVWVPAEGPGQTTAVMSYTRTGLQVTFQRTSSSDGRLCTYHGTVAADGVSASGTETCPGIEETFTWTAMISAPYAPPPIELGLVDFETPNLGEATRQAFDPFVDAATGIQFSADPLDYTSGGVIGITRNMSSGTSACALPEDGNQKLGTGAAATIGFGTWPIRATFPTTQPAGTAVSVQVQTGAGDGDNVVQMRFFDASGTQVSSISQPATGPDVRCEGAPGAARVKLLISTTVETSFKSLVIEGPAATVFVIDNLHVGTP